MSDWYTAGGVPGFQSALTSATIRNEFAAIQTATDKLPTLAGAGSRIVAVNAGGTALEGVATVAVTQGGTGASTASGARTNLGLGSLATLSTINDSNWSGTALAVANGGTGSTSASAARTALGVAIGSDVQAYSARLTEIAALAVTDGNFVVGNGTAWVAEAPSTARASLGLGSLATLSSINNGNWSGTALAVANGGTGATTQSGARTNLGLGSLATQSTISNADWSGTALAVANGGTGATTASGARAALGLTISADVQAYDPDLTTLGGLSKTDGNFIVANGTAWTVESGTTVRNSLGLGALATLDTVNNSNWSGVALAVANGGTGAISASGARTSLGVAIGSDVQAYSARLGEIAALAVTDGNFVVGNGTAWVAESGATARTSLGLGSLATLSSINDSNWAGTALAVANGGTGATSAGGARTNLGLGSLATLSSINDSNWSGTDLAVANGGTGSSTASGARTNLGVGSMATRALTIQSGGSPSGGADGDVFFIY